MDERANPNGKDAIAHAASVRDAALKNSAAMPKPTGDKVAISVAKPQESVTSRQPSREEIDAIYAMPSAAVNCCNVALSGSSNVRIVFIEKIPTESLIPRASVTMEIGASLMLRDTLNKIFPVNMPGTIEKADSDGSKKISE